MQLFLTEKWQYKSSTGPKRPPTLLLGSHSDMSKYTLDKRHCVLGFLQKSTMPLLPRHFKLLEKFLNLGNERETGVRERSLQAHASLI